MNKSEINLILERHLLQQLGDRLRNLRKSKGIGTVELSARAGISRNTLRSVEAGDPSPSIGTYLSVMSALGIGGELALLAGDTLQPAPADSAAARSRRPAPAVRIEVTADNTKAYLNELQSLALHNEALKKIKSNPSLVDVAQSTLRRWKDNGDMRSATLWREWEKILRDKRWSKALGSTRHAVQLRQASPLTTLLSDDERAKVLKQANLLKKGLVLGGELEPPSSVRNRESAS